MSRPEPPRNQVATVGWLAFALVMGGSMVGLFTFLAQEQRAGREAVERWLARGPTELLPPDERDRLAAAGRSVSVSNFQVQRGTGCWWVTVGSGPTAVQARLVLADRPEGLSVQAASLSRECECPDDADLPCALL